MPFLKMVFSSSPPSSSSYNNNTDGGNSRSRGIHFRLHHRHRPSCKDNQRDGFDRALLGKISARVGALMFAHGDCEAQVRELYGDVDRYVERDLRSRSRGRSWAWLGDHGRLGRLWRA